MVRVSSLTLKGLSSRAKRGICSLPEVPQRLRPNKPGAGKD